MRISAHSLENYQIHIDAGNHQFISDEPLGVGDDVGPSPFDLLLGSLASCTIITLHMYAKRKDWPLERVDMTLDIVDGEGADSSVPLTIIQTNLTFQGDLTPIQIKRLEYIATRCPVHRALKGEIQIRTAISNLAPVDDTFDLS